MQTHLCRCFVTHPLEPACRWTLHRMQTHLCRCDNTDPWVYQPRQSRSRPGSDILEDHILPGRPREMEIKSVTCLFVCLFGFLTSSSTTRLYRGRAPRQERLTILRAATHETELGDHDFCLSRSHYTDTDPTCRERAATAGFEPGTSSLGVARSTAELPRPPDVFAT